MMKKIVAIIITIYLLPNLKMEVKASESIPEDAVQYSSNYYKIFDMAMSWEDAKIYCESIGGHLASITSMEENQFIVSIFTQPDISFYWLGATDELQEGEWLWVTGEEFAYENWSENSPNNNVDKEHYLGIMSKEENYDGYPTPIGSWNDFQTTTSDNSGFICEWDANIDHTFSEGQSNSQNDESENTETNTNIKKADATTQTEKTKGKLKDDKFLGTSFSILGGVSIFGGISLLGIIKFIYSIIKNISNRDN